MDGFLAGYVEHTKLLPQLFADLQHQRGFADARSATHQHKGPFHGTTAQNAI